MKFEKGDILHSEDDLNPIGWIIIFDGYYPAFKYSVMLNRDQELVYNNICVSDGFKLANAEQKQILFDALAKENKYYCEKTKTIKEMKKEFTKKDLKSGMWIECRNGNKYLVINNASDGELWGFRYEGKIRLSDYMDDLTYASNKEFDIIGIYGNILGFGDKFTFSFDKQTLIWERETEEDKQIKEMQDRLSEMKKAYNELEKNIFETIDRLNGLKK